MKSYLEEDEVERMEQAAGYLRDKLVVRMLFHLGCRVSEALALTVEDIDLRQGTVTILHLKEHLNLTCPKCNVRLGRSHSFCPGCGARVEGPVARQQEQRRQRTLPIDAETLKMLKDYIQRGGPVKRGDKCFSSASTATAPGR